MTARTYLNFDLSIDPLEEGYCARVIASPVGEATKAFTLPLSDLAPENLLPDSPARTAVEDFGACLFDTVFAGEVLVCFRRSLDEAERQGAGLRIRLRLTGVPELADLPWEYLYDSACARFLILSSDTPLVRYLELQERIRPLMVSPPLRVLVIISNPKDCPQLDVEQEWANLKQAVAILEQRGLMILERLRQPTLAALQRQLRRQTYHICHAIGHGAFDEQLQDGILLLEDENGQSRRVSGQDLGMLLHDEHSLRLVVLNACEGARTSHSDRFAGTAQSLVQQGIPAVIAMQLEIRDEAAITLAREFYGALADGYAVDSALNEARKAIFAQDKGVEWGIPVLYMRSPDGQLFEVAERDDVSAPPLAEPLPIDVRQPRRIDAALPSEAQVGKPIDLVVAVKLPKSPNLDVAEIRAAGVSQRFPHDAEADSRPIEIDFPIDKTRGQPGSAILEIQIITPHFKVHGPTSKSLLVPPDRDSELCTFPLSPRRPGESWVNVEFRSQGVVIGTMRLETMVHPSTSPPIRRHSRMLVMVTLPVYLILPSSGAVDLAASQMHSATPGQYQIRPAGPAKNVVMGAEEVQYSGDTPVAEIDIAAVRNLVRCAFTPDDLRRFCQDQPEFHFILGYFGPKFSFEDMIEAVIEQCRTRALFPELLAAIREHNPRQCERYLDQLYVEAERASEAHNWTQAIGLYRQIVEIDEHYKDASKTLAGAEEQACLEQLYAKAVRASEAHNWTQAIGLYRQIVEIDEYYKDASKTLAEVEEQQHLEQLYAKAEQAYEAHEWDQAIRPYEKILDTDKHYKDVLDKLAGAKKREHLDPLYAEARQAYEAHNWAQAISLCRKIISIDPHYRDTRHLLWKASFQPARQRIVALSVLLLVVVGIVVVLQIVIFPPTTPTPSPTSTLIPIGEVQITIDSYRYFDRGQCRNILAESQSRVEVTVLDSKGATLQSGVFSYRWRFNPPDGHNEEKLGEDFKGNVIIYYASPGLNDQVVTVEVLREGRIVAVRSICFNVVLQP